MDEEQRRHIALQYAFQYSAMLGVGCLTCVLDTAEEIDYFLVHGQRSIDCLHLGEEAPEPAPADEEDASDTDDNVVKFDPKTRH